MNDIQDQIANHYSQLIDNIKDPSQAQSLQQHIAQSVQDGSLYGYLGVPLVSKITAKMNEMKSAQAMKSGLLNQPPIAQQTLAQAQAPQVPQPAPQAPQTPQQAQQPSPGIAAAQSNLPTQAATGGIMGFAMGGVPDPEEMARQYLSEKPDDEEDDEADNEDQEFEDAVAGGMNAKSPGIESISPMMTEQMGQTQAYQGPGMAQPVVAHKEETRVARPTKNEDIDKIVLEKAKEYNANPKLALHVANKETGGLKDRVNAVSPAGAEGIMQIMKGTQKELGITDPFDTEQNIGGGVKYLAKLENKYKDPKLAAMAYNWGPGNVDKWLANGADPRAVPKETQNYTVGLAQGGIAHFNGTDSSLVGDMDYTTIPGMDTGTPYADALNAVKNPPATYPVSNAAPAAQTLMPNRAIETPNYDYSSLPELAKSTLYRDAINRNTPVAAPVDTHTPVYPKKQQDALSGLASFFSSHPGSYNPRHPQVAAPDVAVAPAAADIARGRPTMANDSRLITSAPSATEAASNALGGYDETANAQDQLNPSYVRGPVAAPAVEKAAPNPFDSFNDYLAKREGALQDKKQKDFYMSLLSAGLGMMGKAGTVKPGEVHTLAGDIGEGALPGISYAMNANKENAAEENAILTGKLGIARYSSLRDLQNQQAEEKKYQHELVNNLGYAKILEQHNAAQNALDLRQQGLEERKKKEADDTMNMREKLFTTRALARAKDPLMTQDQKDKIIAEELYKMHTKDTPFREAHKQRFGMYPDVDQEKPTPGGAGWSIEK